MDEATRYKLGDDNPSGVEWVVVMEPEQHGFSITLSNDPRYLKKLQAKAEEKDSETKSTPDRSAKASS